MFGDVAKSLLRAMGMSGEIPGAIQAEDVPAALAQLRKAAEREKPVVKDADNAGEAQRVNFSARAYPLVHLLEAAAKKKQYVMWEERPAASPSPD